MRKFIVPIKNCFHCPYLLQNIYHSEHYCKLTNVTFEELVDSTADYEDVLAILTWADDKPIFCPLIEYKEEI